MVEGQAFAEIEVMKMIQTLASPAAGVISFQVNEGSALAAGALIATLGLDDPTKVKRAETFTGEARHLSPRHACTMMGQFEDVHDLLWPVILLLSTTATNPQMFT